MPNSKTSNSLDNSSLYTFLQQVAHPELHGWRQAGDSPFLSGLPTLSKPCSESLRIAFFVGSDGGTLCAGLADHPSQILCKGRVAGVRPSPPTRGE